MAKLSIKPDSTSVSLDIFILDSTSTVGAGKTGLAYDTASLTCYYSRPTAAPAAISLVTQTVTGAWSSGGFVEKDAANTPGLYRFDIPNAVLAAGARSASVMLKGASGMAPLMLEVDLNAEVNLVSILGTVLTETAGQIAAAFVKFFNKAVPTGTVNSLPDAVAGASNGVAIVGSVMGKSPATLAVADVSGNLPVDLQTIKTQTVTASAGVTFPASIGTSTYAGGAVESVTNPVTAGTVSDKIGYALTSAYDAAKTSATQTSVDDLPTNSELATALGTADDAVILAIAALNNLSSAQAQTAATAALNAYDPPTNAEMEARTLVAASYFDPAADVVAHVTLVDTTTTNTDMVAAAPTAVANADAVWDELLAAHSGAGSAGLALATASSGGVDPSVLADAIWDEALSGHSTAGTTGKKLTDLVNADLSGVATSLALADVPTVAEFEARTLLAASYFDPATDTVASVNLTHWKGDVPSSLVNSAINAYLTDRRVSGFIGSSEVGEAIVKDGTIAPLAVGETIITCSTGIAYDNQYAGWTFVIEDGNSGIAFVTLVTGSSAANDTLTLRDPVPDPGYVLVDDIPYVILPFAAASASSSSGLTAQETADAVSNLAPTGASGAAGSIRATLATVAKTGADGDTLETLSDQIDGVVAGSGLTADETKAVVIAAINSLQQLDEVLEQSPAGALAALFDDNAIDAVTGLPTVVGQNADATQFAAWVAREFDSKLFVGVAHAPTYPTAAVVGSLSSISDTPTFEYMLPEEGVQTMIVGPDNRLYVAGLDERNNATDIQSVYIRDTAGTWTKKQTVDNGSYHIYSLAFEGTRLWAGLGGNMYPTVETKIAYSDDYGDTWNFDSIMSLGDVWDVAVLGSTVILQVWHNVNNVPGIWYSTNAGATWTQVAGIVAHTARLVVWNNLVVGASNDGYMFTVNASGVGTQYTIPFSVLGAPRNRSVVDSEGYLCVAATSGIWRTKDLLTWKRIWTPLPGGNSIKMLGRFGDSLVVSTNNTTAVLYSRPSSPEAAQQQMTRDALKLAPSPGDPETGSTDLDLDNVSNGLVGIGSIPLTYTITEPGGVVPISGVTVELYTEEACVNCVRRGVTNSFGVVTFWMSTAGTYWIRSAKDGYGFELDSETVAV